MNFPGPEPRFPAPLDIPLAITVQLMELAAQSTLASLKEYRRSRRPRRGETLKPGPHTPLWNELSRAVLQELTRHGEKARLARVLGLPRQRLNDFLRQRRHLPDAERTLLLLVWLQLRRKGRDLF